MRRSFDKLRQLFSTPDENRLLPNRRPLRIEPLEGRWLLSIGTLHVDADSAAPTPDGQAWETAYPDLQAALDQAEVLNTDGVPENDVTGIWIAEGTYKPTALLDVADPRTATFSMLDDVSLYGGFYGDEVDLDSRHGNPTVLSGDLDASDDLSDADAYHVVYAFNITDVTLDGLTITGGNAGGTSSPDDRGGGIYNRSGILTVNDSTIMGNSAESRGGGICNYGILTVTGSTISGNSAYGEAYFNRGGGICNSSMLTVTASTISGNSAYAGGGVSNARDSTLTITDTTVSGNSADRSGGGIHNAEGTVTVTGSTISGNSAWGGFSNTDGGGGIRNGGGLMVTDTTVSGNSASSGGGILNSSGTLTVTGSTIFGNSAAIDGGGIFNPNGTLTVTRSKIFGNRADNDGGAIFNSIDDSGNVVDDTRAYFYHEGMVTLSNSMVSGNSAGRNGGGIYNFDRGEMTVFASTVSGNAASVRGGGIYNCAWTMLTVHNTIVAGNVANEGGPDISGTVPGDPDDKEFVGTNSHNLVGDGSGMSNIVHGENGNLVGTAQSPIDPRFVRAPSDGADGWGDDPQTPDLDEGANDDYGDLRLLEDSPAIDAGDRAGRNLPVTDLDGNPRISGDRVDMGAYEFQFPPCEIRGTVFNDRDGDGIWDDREPGMSRWKIYLDQNENGLWDPDELFAMTGPHGDYSFTDLAPGEYIVAEVPRSGWTQTSPDAGGFHTITLEPGQTVEDVLFGNRPGRRAARGPSESNGQIFSQDSDWLSQFDLPVPKSSRPRGPKAAAVDELMKQWLVDSG